MAHVNLAQACQQEGRLLLLSAALAAGLPGAWPAGGAAAALAGARLDEALRHFDRAVRLRRRLARLYSSRARLHLERGDPIRALEDFEPAVRLEAGPGPEKAQDYVEVGRLLERQRRRAEARQAYEAALKVVPGYLEAQRLLAYLLLGQQGFAEANSAFTAYLDRGPPRAEVYLARGLTRVKLGDYPGAVEDYSRALQMRPDSKTRAHRGWAYLALEAPRLALADFQEALRLDRDSADAYNGRGIARVRLGRYREAVGDAEEAVRRDRKAARSLYNAARVFAQAAAQAEGDAGQAKQRQLAEGRKRRYQARALELLQAALDAKPTEGPARFWEGAVGKDPLLDPIRGTPGFAELARHARALK
jgi:tetratricopeptide (TPR) repeat protein